MAEPPKGPFRLRMALLGVVGAAAGVALWADGGMLLSWTLLAVLFGLSVGTLAWLPRSRRPTEEEEDRAETATRRRRLARLTGRPDVFSDPTDDRE